jgi:hypothetical protein
MRLAGRAGLAVTDVYGETWWIRAADVVAIRQENHRSDQTPPGDELYIRGFHNVISISRETTEMLAKMFQEGLL